MNNKMKLLDNSPVVSDNYEVDARILNEKINNPNVKNTAIEAMIGAIYMEENGNNIKEISNLLTKCWINFN